MIAFCATSLPWLVVLVIAFPSLAQSPALVLDADPLYPLPGVPLSLHAADFNRDGTPELAAAVNLPDSDYDRIVLLPGRADGTLGATQLFGDPFRLTTSTIADFDGNGTTDLAAIDFSGYRILFYNNRTAAGAASFDLALAGAYRVDVDIAAILVVDFNNDGQPDFLGWSADSRSLVILQNRGVGSTPFSRFSVQTVALDVPGALAGDAFAAGNWIGDARPDLLIPYSDSDEVPYDHCGLALFRGVQPATADAPPFVYEATRPLGGFPGQLLSGFIDEDSVPDAVAAVDFQRLLECYIGASIGGVATPDFQIETGERANVGEYLLSDLSADGQGDILDPQPRVYENRTGQEFSPCEEPSLQGALFAPADFNRDGRIDLAGAFGESPWAGLFPGRDDPGEASPFFGRGRALDLGTHEAHILAASFDSDGYCDLAAGYGPLFGEGHRVAILQGNALGAPAPRMEIPIEGRIERLIQPGDPAQLTVLASNPNRVEVYALDVESATSEQTLTLPIGERPRDLLLEDLNRDLRTDLLTVHDGSLSTGQPAKLELWEGLAGGGFQFASEREMSFGPGPARPRRPLAADFSGDGFPDVALIDLSRPGGAGCLILFSDGSLDLANYTIRDYPLNSPDQDVLDLALADLNRDSLTDLALLLTRGEVLVPGLGGGEFGNAVWLPGVRDAFKGHLVLANLRQPGFLDLIQSSGQTWRIRPGGEGPLDSAYTEAADYARGGVEIASGDFDGDGSADLAGVDTRYLRIFQNLSNPTETPTPTPTATLTPTPSPTVTPTPTLELLGDFNESGEVDPADLLLLIGERHRPTPPLATDLSGNGRSDGDDLFLFQPYWFLRSQNETGF
jgi:hypothetical protein